MSLSNKQRHKVSLLQELDYQDKITTEFFEQEELITKDVHYASEYVLKSNEESKSSKPFYSSIDWSIAA